MHSYPVLVKDVDSHCDIEIFRIDGAGPVPSMFLAYCHVLKYTHSQKQLHFSETVYAHNMQFS